MLVCLTLKVVDKADVASGASLFCEFLLSIMGSEFASKRTCAVRLKLDGEIGNRPGARAGLFEKLAVFAP